MGKRLKTLAVRLIIVVVLGQAVFLPLVFKGVLNIVEQSQTEMFIDHVRAFSRFLADNFKYEGRLVAKDRAIDILDSATLSSNCVYAELWEGQRRLYQSNLATGNTRVYKEDFGFNRNNDSVYYLAVPVMVPERSVTLRLGFDEQPTLDQIALAYRRASYIFLLYVLISVILVVWLSIRLTRPLRELQISSRKIASGKFDIHLDSDSQIVEIHEMAKDLEYMRQELVGTNKHLQSEIEQRKELEGRRNLLEKQLLQSQKLEMIGTLAGGMAHEFNNILVPIVLYTELAKDALPQESKMAQQLGRVLISADRAKDLVGQILTFSRYRSKKELDPMNLKSIVNESLDMLRAVLPRTIEITSTIEFCGLILGDAAQIQQLVVNLCNNAAKAIGENTGTINVSLFETRYDLNEAENNVDRQGSRYAKLIVEDTGHGMDSDTLERIFQPFFTTADVGQGSGLGLAVVHGIVTSHDGDIRVTSQIDSGTIVEVYLPIWRSKNN